ncbi:hypothetical protein B0H63DRAFT_140311 [Podospora didyma]|uniref:Extracellular membrane protein CFEM domain-containing protein n=1 Tax=Podospora didyma TaxID=330526 RepID=A0AAE0NS95_9PEZI|nr:hypothetical protein B0H63DRAFT_140311 [Podospora didyma]
MMDKLTWVTAALLVLAVVAQDTRPITAIVGTHCRTDADTQSTQDACFRPYLPLYSSCYNSFVATASQGDPGVLQCICKFNLAGSACWSAACDATGYSLYMDSYSSCGGLGVGGPVPTAPASTNAGATTQTPATTPGPSLASTGSGGADGGGAAPSAPTSTKSSGGVAYGVGVSVHGGLLAGFVGAVAAWM